MPDHVIMMAVDWVLLLQRQSPIDRVHSREPLEKWLAADPVHAPAFRAMRVAWAFSRCAKSQGTPADLAELNAILFGERPLFDTD